MAKKKQKAAVKEVKLRRSGRLAGKAPQGDDDQAEREETTQTLKRSTKGKKSQIVEEEEEEPPQRPKKTTRGKKAQVVEDEEEEPPQRPKKTTRGKKAQVVEDEEEPPQRLRKSKKARFVEEEEDEQEDDESESEGPEEVEEDEGQSGDGHDDEDDEEEGSEEDLDGDKDDDLGNDMDWDPDTDFGQSSSSSTGGGKTVTQGKGRKTAHSEGQKSADSEGQKTADSEGQMTADSEGQKTADSEGQKTAHGEGQETTTHSEGPSSKGGKGAKWGWLSAEARKKVPMSSPAKRDNSITLKYDPDGKTTKEKSTPIDGEMLYIVTRGCLFVALPSRNKKNPGLERCVLVKGSDYPEAKQRFRGPTVVSTDKTYLSGTEWKDFEVVNVATTNDGKMTLIEGYVKEKQEMRMFSVSTLRQAYGKPQADALTLVRRAMVGQEQLAKEKKTTLPADVLQYLAGHGVKM